MYSDYHVHSNYSDDSVYLMEDVVKDAIKLGIKDICFTDHVDYGIKGDWDDRENIRYYKGEPIANVDYPSYFKELELLQKKYEEKIKIKKGLEFGVQTNTIEDFQNIFNKYPMDFVILSIHQINNKEFWNNDYQNDLSDEEFYKNYYDEMFGVVQNYHNYSVLGHVDLIKRYDKKTGYSFSNCKEKISEILRYVINDGKGIEVNTSSTRYAVGDMTPSRDILRLYKSLGGEIITIGSDSHKHEHLGAYIEDTKKELKELGFEYHCTFENMKPLYHKL